jgi:hypothetical protein
MMAREPGDAVEMPSSEDEKRDRYLGIPPKRKRGGAFGKKKAPPFGREGKIEGKAARRRADRKAFKRQQGGGVTNAEIAEAQRQTQERRRRQDAEIAEAQKRARGGKVESLADAEPVPADTTIAPPGGAVRQKFQAGGKVPTPRTDPRYDRSAELKSFIRREKREPATDSEVEHFYPKIKEQIAAEQDDKYKSGGHISTAQRKALPSGDFALPGQGKGAGGKGPGSYPIDTENRARNALARGAQHAGPGQLATIKRKVKAKYPGIDVGGK